MLNSSSMSTYLYVAYSRNYVNDLVQGDALNLDLLCN